MNPEIQKYNDSQEGIHKEMCATLAEIIVKNVPQLENKIWHAHPVWFDEGNPIVGYDKLKNGLRLMFWSGASFDEPQLKQGSGKFKDASITFTSLEEINVETIERYLQKAKEIQWDYKNIVKRKGVLQRLK